MMLGPVLAMVNGPIVAEAIKSAEGHLTKFTLANPDDALSDTRKDLDVELPVAAHEKRAGTAP